MKFNKKCLNLVIFFHIDITVFPTSFCESNLMLSIGARAWFKIYIFNYAIHVALLLLVAPSSITNYCQGHNLGDSSALIRIQAKSRLAMSLAFV